MGTPEARFSDRPGDGISEVMTSEVPKRWENAERNHLEVSFTSFAAERSILVGYIPGLGS